MNDLIPQRGNEDTCSLIVEAEDSGSRDPGIKPSEVGFWRKYFSLMQPI